MKKLLFILALSFLFGCQPSRITQTWTAANTVPKKYKKILVLGVLIDQDNELRIKIEDHLAADLRDLGYKALAAHTIFPPETFSEGDTARAAANIIGNGFDAVLTVVLLDKEKERYYIPGKIIDYSNLTNYNRFDLYYNAVAERIYSPGYFEEETKYIWENNFYDLASRQLIYSARSRSFDVTSRSTLAHAYGLLMANSLVDKKILIKPAGE